MHASAGPRHRQLSFHGLFRNDEPFLASDGRHRRSPRWPERRLYLRFTIRCEKSEHLVSTSRRIWSGDTRRTVGVFLA